VLTSAPYPWANQAGYAMSLVRNDNDYTCTIIDTLGASSPSIVTSTNDVPGDAPALFHTRGVSGRLLWLMYIDSPN
jgi:hypothetical protein